MSRANDLIVCPLCGTRYDEAEGLACHSGCLLGSGCRLLSCPHCGYEMPAESRLTGWLARRLGHRKGGEAR